ncbi:MAG: hypothetical protein J7L96_10165, partial [Bacteroidales bacterium]|nr:hypothetical protein [Bacteroidales bacterium]
MRKLNLSLLFLSTILIISCATGKKALQKGNYSEAVFKAIERLRSNPDSKNALQTLRDAYPLAIETLESEIGETLISNVPDKYAIVADKYQLLDDMAKEIRRSPAAKKVIPSPKSYSSQLSGARDKAAEESYQTAKSLLNNDNREDAMDAFRLFEQTLRFNPGYR